jgi:hypothetical protein
MAMASTAVTATASATATAINLAWAWATASATATASVNDRYSQEKLWDRGWLVKKQTFYFNFFSVAFPVKIHFPCRLKTQLGSLSLKVIFREIASFVLLWEQSSVPRVTVRTLLHGNLAICEQNDA